MGQKIVAPACEFILAIVASRGATLGVSVSLEKNTGQYPVVIEVVLTSDFDHARCQWIGSNIRHIP